MHKSPTHISSAKPPESAVQCNPQGGHFWTCKKLHLYPIHLPTKIDMVEQNYMDGISMGHIENEDFESILNGLDFSIENLEADRLDEDWDATVYGELLGPIPSETLMSLPPLELTNVDNVFPEAQGNVIFQTGSPISVLENTRSCSGGRSATSFNFGSKGRRSKRARSSTLNPWLKMAPMPWTTSAAKKNSDSKIGKVNKRKLSGAMASPLFKRCTHCEVTKTPQWREGPLGPKTLCNACGVRYRSGRLLPEYRPAASPTFIPSLHSNSHKKVVEMRRKTVESSPECDSQKNFVPLGSYLLDEYF
ncbi:putative GATA transcription factor 13 [Solanum pennellii]|uniref:GATA transcription factor 13 n=1 Tax=Solanum pennellii TaxID=28526 RepID=A0ABM1H0X6_SOLPN|nr:putative GATA transcription factor 13 [Solanum pennellii]